MLAWLRSPAGQALLQELAASDISDATLLSLFERLYARYSPEQARAAVDTMLLRRRAASKFQRAELMYFTREALEQATSEVVARHRARRLVQALQTPDPHVVDLCCGIGGDALALAEAGCRVTAVDADPLRIALAEANAAALGLAGRISFRCADVTEQPPPQADAIFCDPARRAGQRRVFDTAHYQPPLSHVLSWRDHNPALCVKLAPGIDERALAGRAAYELEFVSLAGELKEAVLWCGPLATTARRATLLPVAVTLTAADRPIDVPLAQPLRFLYEPDPAVIRAHLVRELASQLGAAQLDPTIAYLTAEQLVVTPFARVWHILEWLPFSLKRLRQRVRAYAPGPVTVKKRGSPLDTDALARQLSGVGQRALVVVLTRVAGRPAALICAPAGTVQEAAGAAQAI